MVFSRTARLVIPLLVLCAPLSAPLRAQITSCQASPKAVSRLEYQQAEQYRRALSDTAKLVPADALSPEAAETFQTLISDSTITELHLSFRWRLELVEIDEINAFSFPDGQILVSRPLAERLGHSRGMWAAVLAHEISHVARQHWFQRYCRLSEAQHRSQDLPGAAEDISLGAGLNMLPARQTMVFSREQELDADRQGMLLMAHAGYHPDFFFALNHWLKALPMQDVEKIRYSSTHPGWEERERAGRDRSIRAEWVFGQRWPQAGNAPGGNPPMVVFLGEPAANGDHATVDVQCRNPEGTVEVVFVAWDGKARKRPATRMTSSRILACEPISEVSVPLEWNAEAVRARNLQARFAVLSPDGTVLEYSRTFPLKAPR